MPSIVEEERAADGPYPARETRCDFRRAHLGVQDGLRSLILLARERAGELSPEEAEAACSGMVAPPQTPVPIIDIENEVVVKGGGPVVELRPGVRDSGLGDSGLGEPVRADTELDAAIVQMFGNAGADAVQMFGNAGADAVQMFGDERIERDHVPAGGPEGGRAVRPEEGAPARRRQGRVTLRVRAREETILHYRMLEAAHERSGIGGTFVRFLVVAFWSSWAEVLGRTNACEEILRRDGYDCTSPVCSNPSAPGSHHVVYRSHGGGDEEWNQTSPCSFCHLDGEHGGRLRIRGEAPDLTWIIGRTPIMEVHGRERRLLS